MRRSRPSTRRNPVSYRMLRTDLQENPIRFDYGLSPQQPGGERAPADAAAQDNHEAVHIRPTPPALRFHSLQDRQPQHEAREAGFSARPLKPSQRLSYTRSPRCTKAKAVADNPDDRKGRLNNISGSQSDHWNNTLANQAMQALWVKNSSAVERDKQFSATVAALMGISPKDELEGMMAAQLVAAHNAAMECYRRAMIGEQSFEGRR
jgi:hypothetical protein